MITLMRVNESLNSRSSRINEEAQWKTMRGAHILVDDDGKIVSGPDPSKLNKKKGEGSSKKTSSKETSSKKTSSKETSSKETSSKNPESAYQRFPKDESKATLSKVKGVSKADAENIATVLSNAGPNQDPVFDMSNITGRRGAPPTMRSADDVASMIDYLKGDGFEFESNTSGKRKDNNSVTLYFRNKKTNKLVTAELYNSTN